MEELCQERVNCPEAALSMVMRNTGPILGVTTNATRLVPERDSKVASGGLKS